MRKFLRKWLGIAALEQQVKDRDAFIAKLEERLDAHRQEMEAFRNLMRAKSEADAQPGRIKARRVSEVFAALREGEGAD